MAARIFINYRREDSNATAGRLHDRLAQSFGRKNLFMDVDHLPAGVDFVNHLNSQVATCDVFLAIIGRNWLNVTNEKGDCRLRDPDDFVAIEIAAALARDIRVIPVLVDGARMPKVSELPDSLKPLARRHAIELRHTHFGRDGEALIEKIREPLGRKAVMGGLWRAGAAAGVVAALLPVGCIGVYGTGISIPWAMQPDTRGQVEKEWLGNREIVSNNRPCTENQGQQLETAIRSNLGLQLYSDVYRIADQLKRCDQYKSWFFKGAAAFYQGNFAKSIEYFEEARKLRPNYDTITRNLADAYVEAGGAANALKLYNEIESRAEIVRYKIGRALLYGEDYAAARDMLLTVSTEFEEEGGRGKARILTAAAYAALAKNLDQQSATNLSRAVSQLKDGVSQDRRFWDGILTGQVRSRQEGWTKARELLEPIYGEVKGSL